MSKAQPVLPKLCIALKITQNRGWGFSSVVERLPRKRKALGSVPSSEKKNQKKKKNYPESTVSCSSYPQAI